MKELTVIIQVPVTQELKRQLEQLAKADAQALAATVRRLIMKGISCEQHQTTNP